MASTSGAANTTTDESDPTTTPQPSSGLDPAAKAGIAVGIITFLFLLSFVFWIILRRKQRNHPDSSLECAPPPQIAPPQVAPAYSEKEIQQLSPKQVLGLDDASYLRRLPTQYGKLVVQNVCMFHADLREHRTNVGRCSEPRICYTAV